MEDIRVFKNKREIEQALINLLAQKDFHKITVNAICQTAFVGRSTFYSHYIDKYDLLEKVVKRYSELCTGLIIDRFKTQNSQDIEKNLLKAYDNLLQYHRPLSVLMDVHISPDSDLEKQLNSLLHQEFKQLLKTKKLHYELPDDLAAELLTSNAMIIVKYILSHYDQVNVAMLASYVSKIIASSFPYGMKDF